MKMYVGCGPKPVRNPRPEAWRWDSRMTHIFAVFPLSVGRLFGAGVDVPFTEQLLRAVTA